MADGRPLYCTLLSVVLVGYTENLLCLTVTVVTVQAMLNSLNLHQKTWKLDGAAKYPTRFNPTWSRQ